MNCYKCKRTIDKKHNDCINDNELQSVLHHIQNCKSCEAYYTVMEEIRSDLASFEELDLPKGFHNKLHFALQREAENTKKVKKSLSTGIKAAAIAACSILLIFAAFQILPKQKSYDAMPNMAMEQASEDESFKSEMDLTMADSTQAMPEEKDFSTEDSARNESTAESDIAPQECVPDSGCSFLVDGGSKVLILDVDDVDAVYEDLLQYFPNLLPDSSWVIPDFDEPESYRQLRALMSISLVEAISDDIALQYVMQTKMYVTTVLEYDNYDNEIAGLQDQAYLFIVLY